MTGEIIFNKVTKSYKITKAKYGLLRDAIVESFTRKLKRVVVPDNRAVALNRVSFRIKRGESVGIIGRNGAGKTTILKLISKITYPEKGEISTQGRIGAFIELGAGLHHELTGRENIFLYGAILGMNKKEIDEKFNDIVNFAEIHKFLDTPIKKYSSGMYSRLGFSVCAFCNPDILLVDEVLAVGDVNFQKKCIAKMHDFKKEGRTILFVSHDMEAVRSISERVVYLEKGRIVRSGNPREVIDYYLSRAKETPQNEL